MTGTMRTGNLLWPLKSSEDMQPRLIALALALSLVGALLSAPSQSIATSEPRQSVWNGIYTEEQANRGQASYEASCAACHGADLSGGDEAPLLVGGEFVWTWNGLTVGALFERIRKTMPVEEPGSVSRQEKADILAFILSVNEFPSGDSELASRTSTLGRISFEALQQ